MIIANPVPVDGSWWLVAHQIVCDCVIRTLIPFVMLLVLSGRMMLRLRRMTRQFRSPHFHRRRRHPAKVSATKRINWRKNMMATLFAVVALFAVCQLPRLILRSILLLRTGPDIHLNEDALQRAVKVASVLLVVNATANFFVYSLVGSSFRRGLIRLFSRRSAGKNVSVTTEKKDDMGLESTKSPKPCDRK